MSESWFVYIVECGDGSFYTGIANDVVQRISLHNQGKGAKYTRSHLPVRLIYSEEHINRSSASKREHQIKNLSRHQKEQLIRQDSG